MADLPASSAPSVGGASTDASNFNLDSLGDVTKAQTGKAISAAQNVIPTIDAATKAIIDINKQFAGTLTNIDAGVQKEYDNLTSIRKIQERNARIPFPGLKRMIGIFDSDFNDKVQEAKAQSAVVSLQALKQKRENAATARDLAVNTVNTMTEGAIKKLNAENTTLDIMNKSINTQRELLAYSGERDKFEMARMTDAQLANLAKTDPKKADLVQNEMARRGSRDLSLQQLQLTTQDMERKNKNLSEQDRIARLTDEELIDPTKTKGLNPQFIKEAQRVRGNETEEAKQKRQQTVANDTALLEKNIKDYGEHANPDELRKQFQLAQKNGGAISIPTKNGSIRLTSQQLLTAINANTEARQKFMDTQGARSAEMAEAANTYAIASAKIDNLNRALPTGLPADVQASIKAYSDAFKAGQEAGSPKAMKDAGDKITKVIDDATNQFTETLGKGGKDFVKQVVKNGFADSATAAPYMLDAASTPAFARGGKFEKYGPELTMGIAQAVAPSAVKVTAKGKEIDYNALLTASGVTKKDPAQVTREVLAKKDANGVSIASHAATDMFAEYTTAILQKLSIPGSNRMGGATQQGNPYEQFIDPVTGHIAASILDEKNGLSFKKLMEQLAFETISEQKAGLLPAGQDLLDNFVRELDNDKNKAEWVQSYRNQYTLTDHAFAALLFNNREGNFINDSLVTYIQSNMSEARAVAQERMKQAEVAAQTIIQATGGPLATNGTQSALGIPTPTSKTQSAAFPFPIKTLNPAGQ